MVSAIWEVSSIRIISRFLPKIPPRRLSHLAASNMPLAHSLPESPHRPEKGMRLPTLRVGWPIPESGSMKWNKRKTKRKRMNCLFISFVSSGEHFHQPLALQRLCRKSVHGSTSSPRTDHGLLKINYLAVRPEHVEGRTVNCDTVSHWERVKLRFFTKGSR